jgi:2',3'-cyclic-nucleotide 2'-phosphodiesterase/3'-nucleotidase
MRFAVPLLMLTLIVPLSAAAGGKPAPGATAVLAVLETTDLHANVIGFDYFKLAPDAAFGLDRAATLIAQARRDFPNTLLLDNGDTIQGSALADYQALAAPLACDKVLAIYKAMNRLGFEGGGIGNHEFNYGLPYLRQVTGQRFDVDGVDQHKPRCAGPRFPQVLANVYSTKTRKPLFAPYRIIDKQVSALGANGKPIKVTLKVGIIGFTPPTIMEWDRRHLAGKLYTEGVRESARKFIPAMRAQGADVIVAISHGGLDDRAYSPTMENGNYYLAQVPGIDAMLIGHSHQLFPDPGSKVAQFNLPGVDKVRGLVHGVPTVMANQWGSHLGVIGLHLRFDGKHWQVQKAQTTVEARSTRLADKQYVDADPAIAPLIATEHAATIAYVQAPVGASEYRLSSYFADVGEPSAMAIVNLAQAAFVRRAVQAGLPQLASLPVLSMASAFKSGNAGPRDFTDVAPGPLARNHAADLYLYPNTLYAVKVNGAELAAWLEHGAQRFNTIDPAVKEAQELINPGFPSYNFDVLTDSAVSYDIDVTRAPGSRIRHLRYMGAPVTAGQVFLVATNNYRASGGGGFPGLDGSKTVLASTDTNRDVLIAYIGTERILRRDRHAAERSWRFSKVKTAGPVVFHSAPDKLMLAREAGLANVTLLRADDGAGKGLALYQLDLAGDSAHEADTANEPATSLRRE